jgi:hypothetical protein
MLVRLALHVYGYLSAQLEELETVSHEKRPICSTGGQYNAPPLKYTA